MNSNKILQYIYIYTYINTHTHTHTHTHTYIYIYIYIYIYMLNVICHCGTIDFFINSHEKNNWYSCFTINFSKCFKGIFFSRYTIITNKKVLLLPFINMHSQALVCDTGGEPFKETVISS